MHKLIGAALVAVTLSAAPGAATAQQTSETRAVDARVLKVKVGGVIDLHVKQGATASLVIAGDQKYVSKVITTQQGDTLHMISRATATAILGTTTSSSCAPN
jgi:hypothetical protein